MNKGSSKYYPIWLSIILTLAIATPAYAYLDPGSGSVIYQSVVIIFLAIAASGRLWWSKVKGILRRYSAKSKNHDG
jgi:hypothetical protein